MSYQNSLNNFHINSTLQNSKNNKTLHRSTHSINNYYSMSSPTSVKEIFYSDSESSCLLILPQQSNLQNNMSLSTSSNMVHYIPPLATSSPLKNNDIKDKNYNKKTELEYPKKHPICYEKFLNETNMSEIFKLELCLKMIPGNISPYFSSLKHDVLQLMNSCMYKNINGIVKNIYDIMNLNTNSSFDIILNKTNYSTIPFVSIDLNALHLLNNKLEHVYTILKPFKLIVNGTLLEGGKFIKELVDKKCIEKYIGNSFGGNVFSSTKIETLDIDKSNSVEPDNDNDSIRNITKSDTIPSINNLNKSVDTNSDGDYDMRKKNVSNTISLLNNSNIFIESSQEKALINDSLQYEIESENKRSLEILPDINLSNKELNSTVASKPINTNNYISSQINNYDDINAKANKKGYWLRHRPKSTEHYFSPYKPNLIKKKTCVNKTKYNDVFVYGGTCKQKVILQYKVHSILKANSNELINKLCPEYKKRNYDNENTTLFDISNLKPKKNDKPCLCGIFPSQVPSTWNNSLHLSIHKNLHKLQFKSLSTIDVLIKINNKGFFYNIIKINKHCGNDKNLKLTLKNIQDFINLEINFSKKNINSNHSIFLAVNPDNKIIGYLEIESINNACIYQNNQLSENLVEVKFGVSKLWVMIMYRNNGVAKQLLKQFCEERNLKSNDIAFAYHGNHGISFIKNYYGNNSILIYSTI